MRLQRVLVGVLAGVISVLTAYIVVGQQFAYGRVLLSVSDNHGIHLTDLPIIGMWAVAMAVCGVLWLGPSSGE